MAFLSVWHFVSVLQSRFFFFLLGKIGGGNRQGTKKGIPLYPNLVNLKSNTMKNTMQRYALGANMQICNPETCSLLMFFNN